MVMKVLALVRYSQ